ncbi:MAG: FAD-binding protein [Saprospiraceae bacterium]|nr:FAD-binding protein [Saprospiraceae bacterium]
MKRHSGFIFKNWAKNVISPPLACFQPETELEIIELVKNYPKVKVVGAGHSWSKICDTDGILINLDLYNKVIHLDKKTKTIRVQSGIRIRDLNDELSAHGLALENMGSIDHQTISGAVSTGTHGTGIDFCILGDQIIEFTLIRADGTLIEVHRDKDTELFNAAIVSLGCLGIMSEMVIQAVDSFNLHDITTTRPFDEVINQIDKLYLSSDHFKIWWLPPTDDAVVFTYNRTRQEVNDSNTRRYLKDRVFSVAVYRTLVFIASVFPRLARPFNAFLTSQMKGPLNRIIESNLGFTVPDPPYHYETEWAFDAANAKELLKEYSEWFIRNKYYSNFIQEIRFTKNDSFWLSGCTGRNTIWLGLYCFRHEDFENRLKHFEEFATRHNGRPHWGKRFNVSKGYLEKQYPNYADFVKLRAEMDPGGKFENDFISQLFSE